MENIVSILTEREYFDALDTLDCGQIFRFRPFKDGFKVMTLDKCAYIHSYDNVTEIECKEEDREYFYHYFDLDRDYSDIVKKAKSENIGILTTASEAGKGIRILNQNKREMLFSFIVSQNNNIPSIKNIIEKLCNNIGEEKTFMGEVYHGFPTVKAMSEKDEDFYKSLSLGYRARYIKTLADEMEKGFDIDEYDKLTTPELKKSLIKIYGVGAKVADCVSLFGFHRSDSFPVDTWIEKVYVEDFKGGIKDRNKIANWFVEKFGAYSGYFQQYLFYYKRVKEKSK